MAKVYWMYSIYIYPIRGEIRLIDSLGGIVKIDRIELELYDFYKNELVGKPNLSMPTKLIDSHGTSSNKFKNW